MSKQHDNEALDGARDQIRTDEVHLGNVMVTAATPRSAKWSRMPSVVADPATPVFPPPLRRERLHTQSMNLPAHPLFNRRINQLLRLKPIRPFKLLRNNHRTKMSAPIQRTSVPDMQMALVNNLQIGRRERFLTVLR